MIELYATHGDFGGLSGRILLSDSIEDFTDNLLEKRATDVVTERTLTSKAFE